MTFGGEGVIGHDTSKLHCQKVSMCIYFFNNTLMNFDIGLIHNYDSYIQTHIIYSESDKKFIDRGGGGGGKMLMSQ